MASNNVFDIAIIGGGISSCVFVYSHIKNGFSGRIALIENGRHLGGRSSTRNSLNNYGWKLNHGSPNFNIRNSNNNKLLKTFINELLDLNIIQFDPSNVIRLYENTLLDSEINTDFYKGTNYICRTNMSQLSQDIISINNTLRNQVEYFFETLIIKLNHENNQWILTSKNGYKFKSKFLICSSNLLLHKRSLNILNTNHIPLRKAIPLNKDKKIDKIIKLLNQQEYIPRLTFLIYTNSNYSYKDNYKKKYRYFLLSKILEDKFKFERIIFQKQENNKLGIVVHVRNKEFINEFHKNKNIQMFKKNILLKFNELFDKNSNINKIIDYQDISIMNWRSSQPFGLGIPEYLQLCENYNIAFCGDWFDLEGFGRVEGAILSALKLSHKINSQF